jgi:hypothetical protein
MRWGLPSSLRIAVDAVKQKGRKPFTTKGTRSTPLRFAQSRLRYTKEDVLEILLSFVVEFVAYVPRFRMSNETTTFPAVGRPKARAGSKVAKISALSSCTRRLSESCGPESTR